jgi:hypothetical protein
MPSTLPRLSVVPSSSSLAAKRSSRAGSGEYQRVFLVLVSYAFNNLCVPYL